VNGLNINSAFFIGIGGIGMSALALYMHSKNIRVYGYDRIQSSITNNLNEKGIEITFKDDMNEIPSAFLLEEKQDVYVVYTPAIPSDQNLLNYFQRENYQVLKRSDALAEALKDMKTIAVAGTHGKTTTSSILAHVLNETIGCNAFLGGISNNLQSNFLLNEKTDLAVVEADEYDKSFLKLSPFASIITSIEADHLDIYETEESFFKVFQEFAEKTSPDGFLIKNENVTITDNTSLSISNYGLNANETGVSNFRIEDNSFYFDLNIEGNKIADIPFHLPGDYNALNACAASFVAYKMGANLGDIKSALSTYSGVKRRFEYIINDGEEIFIDDYAHHPGELNACINAVKQLYPNKRILGIFQPHLFSRTQDFLMEFASALENLDQIVLLDIYPARELPIPGITSKTLLDEIKHPEKELLSKSELNHFVANAQFDILLTLGAGDIDRCVIPLRDHLIENRKITKTV